MALVHGSDDGAACGWAGYKIGEQVTVLAVMRSERGSWSGGLWTDWCRVSLYQKHAADIHALLEAQTSSKPQ